MAPAVVRSGCSSWTSDAWWGKVYPRGLPDGERLARYSLLYDTVEVDSSYYRDPGPYLTRRWASVTPEGFVFTLKFPRDLMDPRAPPGEEGIPTFLRNARNLGEKLGPILLQFPPWFKPGPKSWPFLLDLLGRLESPLQFAVELRDAHWFGGEDFERLMHALRERHIALAWSYLTYVDVPPEITSEFVYLRFIGDHTTIPADRHGSVQVDRTAELRLWAKRVEAALERVKAVYVFFNNHFQGFAPESVNLFRKELGQPPVEYLVR